MSHNSTCLNCEQPVSRKFCPECGQKTNTHRITFKHFVFHDIVHGVWHFEKGILFTLKESLFRPGQAALNYISGKRIRYYNVFYLILLLIGLGIFIENLYAAAQLNYVSYVEPDEVTSEKNSAVLDFLAKYAKFILLLAIPAFSLNTYVLFNKRKFNYSEHIIIFGMLYLGIIVIALIGNVLYFTEFVKSIAFITDLAYYFVPIATFIYLLNGLYGAFGKDYGLFSFSMRVLLFMALIIVYIRITSTIIKLFLV